MIKKEKHIITSCEGESVNNFPEVDLHFPETKEEAWAKLLERIESKDPQPKHVVTLFTFKIALAASILLLLCLTAFLRFYTKTIICPAGQHLAILLPDSSSVELNAQSSVTYHPFWMKFDRIINLEGEGYFKVKPGGRFKVLSSHGETAVLGTTFNIYSRGEDYNVSCFTGKVRVVSSINKETIVLTPNQQAFIQTDGSIKIVHPSNIQITKSWTQNMFIFTGASLKSVIQEIERQYNIKIKTQSDFGLTYTGNFNRSISEKEVLDLVCTSLELKFEAKSNGEYLIYKH
jgi:transmembrane sensor